MQIVFVHGVGGTEAVWEHQLARFPEAVALTLPGHPTGQGRHRIDDYVDFVADWIERRGIRDFLLAGHSMGGAIAQSYAQRYPDRVRALGLLATGARLRVLPTLLEEVRADFPAFVDRMAEWALAPEAPAELKERYRRETLQVSPETIYDDWVACDGFDNLEGLGGIRQPALIVAGERDQLTPVKYSEYFHRHLPRSRLVVLPRVGHFVQWEDPEGVNRALEEFLRDLDAQGASEWGGP